MDEFAVAAKVTLSPCARKPWVDAGREAAQCKNTFKREENGNCLGINKKKSCQTANIELLCPLMMCAKLSGKRCTVFPVAFFSTL